MPTSKRDYEAIARILNTERAHADSLDTMDRIDRIAVRTADYFCGTNAGFDRIRFLLACGVITQVAP